MRRGNRRRALGTGEYAGMRELRLTRSEERRRQALLEDGVISEATLER